MGEEAKCHLSVGRDFMALVRGSRAGGQDTKEGSEDTCHRLRPRSTELSGTERVSQHREPGWRTSRWLQSGSAGGAGPAVESPRAQTLRVGLRLECAADRADSGGP